jgi:Leucine-rich repeat (LRR) protein
MLLAHTIPNAQSRKSFSKKSIRPAIMTLVYVKEEKMSIKSLAAMTERFPEMEILKLEEVELEGTDDDIIALAKALRGHQYLEEFRMANVTLTDKSLSLDHGVSIVLVTVEHLKVVKLEKVPISSSALASVGYCTGLKKLSFPNSGLTDKDATALASAVTQSTSIEVVDISGNDLSDLGCIAFATALKKNTSIQSIRFDGNGKISGEQRNLIETTLRGRAGGMTQAA